MAYIRHSHVIFPSQSFFEVEEMTITSGLQIKKLRPRGKVLQLNEVKLRSFDSKCRIFFFLIDHIVNALL